MKVFRIIISLILVGAAGLMMVQDLKHNDLREIKLTLGDFRAQELSGWYRERDWESWIERQLAQKAYPYTQEGKAYVLQGKADFEKKLENLIQNWNQNEQQRFKLESKALALKEEKRQSEISELKSQEQGLDQLLLRLASIQPDQVKAPQFSFDAAKNIPKIKTGSVQQVEAKKVSASATNQKQLVTGPAELDSIEASIESMKKVIQSQLNGLESNLLELQAQNEVSESTLLSEIRIARIEEGKLANQSLKVLYTELQSLQKELKKDLNQMASFISKVDDHQTSLWYHEKNLLMERLGLKRSSLKRKVQALEVEPKAKALQPIYAKLTTEKLQMTQSQIAESFRFLLAGLLICLLFNLIWEVISQRETI